jgi:hypothetical protein
MALKAIKYQINGETVREEYIDWGLASFPPVEIGVSVGPLVFRFAREDLLTGALIYEFNGAIKETET